MRYHLDVTLEEHEARHTEDPSIVILRSYMRTLIASRSDLCVESSTRNAQKLHVARSKSSGISVH